MSLTTDQQRVAEQAVSLIPVCLAAFKRRYSGLRKVADVADLEGAAMLAITKAARTYDPSKAGISAYFSRAIRNACIREIEREIRSGNHSHFRVSYEAAELRQPPESEPLASIMWSALEKLSEEDRRILEERFLEKKSYRKFANEWGTNQRAARKQIMIRLDRLANQWRESPHR